MKLHRVLYCSRNRLPASSDADAEVEAILAASRANNSRDGVTGGLIFSEGCFAQVLEGPLEAVEAAFERIQCDARHGDITVIRSEPISARDFPDWSMAFTQAPANSRLSIEKAFSDRTSGGSELLEVLRGVVVRENEWLS